MSIPASRQPAAQALLAAAAIILAGVSLPPPAAAQGPAVGARLPAGVKGTEKFWNDGLSGEAILQLRAAALCDDNRLTRFLDNRPGHPFHPNVPSQPPPSAIAA